MPHWAAKLDQVRFLINLKKDRPIHFNNAIIFVL